MKSDPTFNEDDFKIEETGDSEPTSLESVDSRQPGVRKTNVPKKKLAIAIAGVCSVVTLSIIGVVFYLDNQSGNDLFDLETESGFALDAPKSELQGLEDPEKISFKVSFGDNGVEINDVESQIATALLDDRPTHMEVDRQINNRLDELFSDPENQAKLRAMNRADRQELQRSIEQVKSTLTGLRSGLAEVRSEVARMSERQDASDKSLAILAGKIKKQIAAAKPKKAKRVVLEPRLQWKVTAMTGSLAIIQNDKTSEKLRVAVGHKISGCGHVKTFDVKQNSLTTSSGCIIKRRKA